MHRHDFLVLINTVKSSIFLFRLSNSDDSIGEGNNFHEDVVQRSKRNIDISSMNVVVHTIEGCLPLRYVPFLVIYHISFHCEIV